MVGCAAPTWSNVDEAGGSEDLKDLKREAVT